MRVDLEALEATANEMQRWEDESLASEQECMKCRDAMHTPSDLEPTPLCNLCAQNVVAEMPALIARIRELESLAAVAYDLTHEEGAIGLHVGVEVEVEDIHKITRHVDVLLKLGKLHRKGTTR